MKKLALVSICTIFITIIFSVASYAESPKIDIPSDIQITKDDDVSAGMLSKLLGTEWQTIAGGKASDNAGGASKFAGAFVLCLSIFNTVAMLFMSTAILYIWGVAAVQTAHEGKEVGGTNFNSFWAPLRHVFAFSCVVPCTANGLSLLQAFCIMIISFSINMANVVWDNTGKYIIEHSQQGVIDNAPPFIDAESLSLIRPLYKAVLGQEIDTRNGLMQVAKEDFPSGDITTSTYKRVNVVNGKYIVTEKPLEGELSICVVPQASMPLDSLGCITIPLPKPKFTNNTITLPTDKEELTRYNAHKTIAYARALAVIEMGEQLRQWARYNMSLKGIISPVQQKPGNSGMDIAKNYRESVSKSTKSSVDSILAQSDIRKILENSMDSKDGKSQLGWATAGLMPFVFARAQTQIDTIVYAKGAESFQSEEEKTSMAAISVLGQYAQDRSKGSALRATTEKGLYDDANRWAVVDLLQGRLYNSAGSGKDGVSTVNRWISSVFSGSSQNDGILATTLSNFKKSDPMVILSHYGAQCTKIAAMAAGFSLGLGAVPVLGAIATNPFVVGGMGLLWTVGITLEYVLPFTILVMWLWALIKWAATVIYVLIGAPLWAMSHIAPQGHGMAGDSAKEGYYTLLDLALRPCLLVVGIVASMGLWSVLSDLYLTLFAKFINSYTSEAGNSLVGELVLSCIVMIVFAGVYAKVFSICINAGPNLVLRMRGGRAGASLDGGDDDGRYMAGAVGVAAGKAGALTGAAVGTAQKSAHSLAEKMKSKGDDNSGKSVGSGGVGSGGADHRQIAPSDDEDGGGTGGGTGGGGGGTGGNFSNGRGGNPGSGQARIDPKSAE